MEALALVVAAAVFGYFATLVARRYEVLRSIAVDIDAEVQEAVRLTGTYAETEEAAIELLNGVHAHLIQARLEAASLPQRQRIPVEKQVRMAQDLTRDVISALRDHTPLHAPQVPPSPPGLLAAYLQAPILASREVLAPLLLPPPLLGYRRPGKPRAFPTPEEARDILESGEPVLARLFAAHALVLPDD